MPLSLEITSPSDLPDLVGIHFAAFQENDPVDRIIHPFGPTPSIRACALTAAQKASNDPGSTTLKVVDYGRESISGGAQAQDSARCSELPPNTNGIIIAFARYRVWREQREAKDWDVSYSAQPGELGPATEVNLKASGRFNGLQKEFTRRLIRGRPCIYLHRLATHPAHQHRGAATMLLKSVIETAERERLDVWLQASPLGHPLYRKLGFQDVAAFEVDLGELGGDIEVGAGQMFRMVMMRYRTNKT